MTKDSTPATKGDLKQLEDKLGVQLKDFKDEILRHFDLAVETIRHDLLGANRDDIEVLKDARHDHERRIIRLERSAGTVAR